LQRERFDRLNFHSAKIACFAAVSKYSCPTRQFCQMKRIKIRSSRFVARAGFHQKKSPALLADYPALFDL
jgi:hypothetical protein